MAVVVSLLALTWHLSFLLGVFPAGGAAAQPSSALVSWYRTCVVLTLLGAAIGVAAGAGAWMAVRRDLPRALLAVVAGPGFVFLAILGGVLVLGRQSQLMWPVGWVLGFVPIELVGYAALTLVPALSGGCVVLVLARRRAASEPLPAACA
jgi:hypothetical protein